jgi:acyl carrier protein
MKDGEIAERLREIARGVRVSEGAIAGDVDLIATGEMDSMTAIDYLIQIEDAFKVNVTVGELRDGLGAIPSLARHLAGRLASAEAR